MARQSAEKIAELQDLVRRKREELDEDSFRYFLGEQALKLGHGGQTLMVRLSGASVSTVRKGMSEVRARILGEEPEPPKKKSPSPKGFPGQRKAPGGLSFRGRRSAWWDVRGPWLCPGNPEKSRRRSAGNSRMPSGDPAGVLTSPTWWAWLPMGTRTTW